MLALQQHAVAGGSAARRAGTRRNAAAIAAPSRLSLPSPSAAAPSPSPSPPRRRRRPALPAAAQPQQQQPPPASAASAPPAGASNPRGQMLVYVPPHPLIKHWLAVARSAASPPPLFRGALAELGRALLYELSRDGGFLPTLAGAVDTAGGHESDVEFVDPTKPIVLVPVVRAGLPLLEHSSAVFPATTIHHIAFAPKKAPKDAGGDGSAEGAAAAGGAPPASAAAASSAADNKSAAAAAPCSLTMTLNTLPATLSEDDRVVIADAVLASGDTAMRAVAEVVARGASPWNVRVVCALAAPPALKRLADRYPGLCVYAGCIDAEVDGKTGLLRPGFGDASLRAFGG